MGFVYRIWNDINDKVYIGKTEFSIEQRFKQHCRDMAKRSCEKRPLYSAMKKFGIECFHIEQLEECSDSYELCEKERKWIEYYDSYHNGYNATIGGDGKPYLDYDLILNNVKLNHNAAQTAREIGCSVDMVRMIAHYYDIPLDNIAGRANLNPAKKVSCFDKNGNFVQSFASVAEGARWCIEKQLTVGKESGARSHIAECANGKRKSAYGYIWRY